MWWCHSAVVKVCFLFKNGFFIWVKEHLPVWLQYVYRKALKQETNSKFLWKELLFYSFTYPSWPPPLLYIINCMWKMEVAVFLTLTFQGDLCFIVLWLSLSWSFWNRTDFGSVLEPTMEPMQQAKLSFRHGDIVGHISGEEYYLD